MLSGSSATSTWKRIKRVGLTIERSILGDFTGKRTLKLVRRDWAEIQVPRVMQEHISF